MPLRSVIKRVLRTVSTRRARAAALRAAFASMTEGEQDQVREQWQIVSMDWSLRNLSRLGFSPSTIVDVGAFQGDWTRVAKRAFPDASILMIEAQTRMRPSLEAAKMELGPTVQFEIALLGPNEASSVPFFEHETGSTMLFERSSVARTVTNLPMRTLDSLVPPRMPTGPDLLKLDVQGFELEILKGGTRVMSRAEAIVLEVSLIALNDGAPLLADVTDFMSRRGFLAYDVCGLVRRPLDNALWQMDILFLHQRSPLRGALSYD